MVNIHIQSNKQFNFMYNTGLPLRSNCSYPVFTSCYQLPKIKKNDKLEGKFIIKDIL